MLQQVIKERISKVREAFDAERLNLIAVELSLGFTFIDCARLSQASYHADHYRQALINAQNACDFAAMLLAQLPADNAPELHLRRSKLADLLESFSGTVIPADESIESESSAHDLPGK